MQYNNTWQPKKTHHMAHPKPLPPLPATKTNTCLHLLPVCTNTTFNNIRTTKHNKSVWKIHKLLLSHFTTKKTLLMHANTHVGNPLENTILTWLYPCLCTTRLCHCLTKLKVDILIITTTSQEQPTLYHQIYNLLTSCFAQIGIHHCNSTKKTQIKKIDGHP